MPHSLADVLALHRAAIDADVIAGSLAERGDPSAEAQRADAARLWRLAARLTEEVGGALEADVATYRDACLALRAQIVQMRASRPVGAHEFVPLGAAMLGAEAVGGPQDGQVHTGCPSWRYWFAVIGDGSAVVHQGAPADAVPDEIDPMRALGFYELAPSRDRWQWHPLPPSRVAPHLN
jgi:hypothetical protein